MDFGEEAASKMGIWAYSGKFSRSGRASVATTSGVLSPLTSALTWEMVLRSFE
jgi:hypothetical protein